MTAIQQHPFTSKHGRPCPHAASEDTMNDGMLVQEGPTAPPLAHPVELLRCRRCHHRFRVDGAPYDDTTNRAAWAAFRLEMARSMIWP